MNPSAAKRLFKRRMIVSDAPMRIPQDKASQFGSETEQGKELYGLDCFGRIIRCFASLCGAYFPSVSVHFKCACAHADPPCARDMIFLGTDLSGIGNVPDAACPAAAIGFYELDILP